MRRPQTIFFGSGPVALESLRQISSTFDFEAIITKPATTAEIQAAFPSVHVLTVSNRAELDSLVLEQQFVSTFGILIDFGIIVSEQVIDTFPKGIINSHFSLLPEWRGADPITFAILSGQQTTGVSLMLLSKGMDEGLLIAQEAYTIAPEATTPNLTTDLIGISSRLLKKIVPEYVAGAVTPYAQDHGLLGPETIATYSRKLSKEDGAIDWTRSAQVLEREIRAFTGWPGSYTKLGGKDVIITSGRVVELSGAPGTVLVEGKRLYLHCGEQTLEILSLKPSGKKEMTAAAFLAGYGRLL